MRKDPEDFELATFAPERRTIVDGLEVGARRHMVHALVEVDVTRARALIRERAQATGRKLSFTAFVVACVARAVDENKLAHAYRDWRDRLVLFADVDVATLVESHVDRVAVPHVIRAANRKAVDQIHDEIRKVQAEPAASKQSTGWLVRASPFVPSPLRRLSFRLLRGNPWWLKKAAGTVVVSSVGMFSGSGGWGVGIVPMHTLCVTVGGISTKPGAVDGRIEIRDYLALTVSVDHDIVDGAPAARFVNALRRLLERADGLAVTGVEEQAPREGPPPVRSQAADR
jgi:pyruvate/2-oxoglutarate dehydrogenase complex dihydrolipoamide acyltransferase (E2) component